jgi:hypothetical protein
MYADTIAISTRAHSVPPPRAEDDVVTPAAVDVVCPTAVLLEEPVVVG